MVSGGAKKYYHYIVLDPSSLAFIVGETGKTRV